MQRESVLKPSEKIEGTQVCGFEFNNFNGTASELLQSFKRIGFQATHLGTAMDIVQEMIDSKAKIFLGYTSNMVSSGIRDVLRFLVQHRRVHCLVSTAGGIEEDFIKCLGPTYLGAFNLDGKQLRAKGLNRIGNLVVPNDNYCMFEDWLMPILDQMLIEQRQGTLWTPSKVIHRLGKEINHPDSIYYWAYKHNIPVYCPAITDGSLGDMLYFHTFKNPGLVIDIVADIRKINDEAVFADKTGMIILGGGLVKHHICNANLMRNGAEYAVYLNTGQEFDGSDSGASPEEAVSWGKIKGDAKSVKVCADASIVFPLIVAETFAKVKLDLQANADASASADRDTIEKSDRDVATTKEE